MLRFGSAFSSSVSLTPASANTAVPKSTAAEETLATINLSANQIAGKRLNVIVANTNANTLATVRTWRVKLGGTVLAQWVQNGSQSTYSVQVGICDRGDNTQRSTWLGINGCTGSANGYTASVTTSAATTLTITAEIASVAGSETTTLEFYVVELIS